MNRYKAQRASYLEIAARHVNGGTFDIRLADGQRMDREWTEKEEIARSLYHDFTVS